MNRATQTQQANTSGLLAPSQGILQRKCACGNKTVASGECSACAKKKKMNLQRRATNTPNHSGIPPIVHDVLSSPGQPLDNATRTFMEPRFGSNFSGVKIHNDSKASESASSVSALAYTVGNHIVFRAGQYNPQSSSGRNLLAHELTHTLQQKERFLSRKTMSIGEENSPLERNADTIANQIMAEGSAGISSIIKTPVLVQRTCGSRDIGSVSGCIGVGGQDILDIAPSGNVYRFEQNCDDLRPGESARISSLVTTLVSGDTVDIHGFASEEGDATFNDNLSCARAHVANVFFGGLVPVTLFNHGPVAGAREDRRSVIIIINRQSDVCGPDATGWYVRQVNSASSDPDVLSVKSELTAANRLARSLGTTVQDVAAGGGSGAVLAMELRLGSSSPARNSVISSQLSTGISRGRSAASNFINPLDVIDVSNIMLHLSSAALKWKGLVNHGARFDFKVHSMSGPSTAGCPVNCANSVTLCPGTAQENCYLTDLPGNLFYAQIGVFAGWDELTLQLGSQLAQLTGTSSWDPPQDTAAIHLGALLPVPMVGSDLCGRLPSVRGSLNAVANCNDCTEATTALII